MKKTVLTMMLFMVANLSFAAKIGVYSQDAPEPIGVYSQAIKVGDTVYISGQIPIDPHTGNMVSGNFKDQTRQALANINALTKAAGGNMDSIVKVTVFLTDLSHFTEVNEIMKESFHPPYPARSVIEIKALPKNAAIEIEAVMQLGSK